MAEFQEAQAPYPGLRPFEAHESEIFFGREGHTDRLLEILQRQRFLAVIGPSGSGKSSLVRAGLLPALARGGLGTGSDWRIALLRPGDQPLRSLARALLAQDVLGRELDAEFTGPDREPDAADVALLEAELRRGPLGLVHSVQAAQARRGVGNQPFNLLVLVDQFEELFTYAESGGERADESEAFVDLLLAARAQADSRICVALTMRTDFLGNCVRFADLPEAINRAQYLTPRLKADEVGRAITGPAAVFGGSVDAGLVAEIVNATGRNPDQLPLLQHALARMWRVAGAGNPGAPHIDWHVAEQVGGITGALNQHADALLAGVKQQLPPQHQTLPEKLFRAITERRLGDRGGQDVRRPQTLARIAQQAGLGDDWQPLVPIVRAFTASDVCFLQHGKTLDGGSVIDLAHEALIRQWMQLAGWVADEAQRAAGYRRWRERATDHDTGGASLLTGNDLARAVEWWNPEPGDSGRAWVPDAHWAARYRAAGDDGREFERTVAFIAASRDADRAAALAQQQRAERETQWLAERTRLAEAQARLARRQTALVSVVAALALATALGAWWYRSEALIQKAQADASAKSAEVAAKYAAAQAAHADYMANEADAARLRADVKASEAEAVASAAVLAKAQAQQDRDRAVLAERTARTALQEANGRRIATDSMAMLDKILAGGDLAAMRLALAGHRIAPHVQLLSAMQAALLRVDSALVWDTDGVVSSIAISHGGQRIVSGGEDGTVRLWDAKSGQPIGKPLKGHKGGVRSVAITPDGQHIASGGQDGTVQLWDLQSGQPIGQLLTGHKGSVRSVAIAADGQLIVSGGFDDTVRLWDARSGQPIGQPLQGHEGGVNSVAIAPDGQRIVSAGFDGTVRVWDVKSGQPIGQPLRGHEGQVFSVVIAPDGQRIVSGGDDGTVRVWDVQGGQPIGQPLKGHRGGVWRVAITSDGQRIVSGGFDGTVRLWDSKSGQPIGQTLKGHESRVSSVAIAPDGQRIVSSGFDGTLRLWNAKSGQPTGQPLTEHKSPVVSVAIAHDDRRIVSGGDDGAVWVRDANSGQPIGQPLKGHEDRVWSVAFFPDGQRIASGGQDRTVRLWDSKSGQPIGQPLKGHKGPVSSVAIAPDGQRIVSGGFDGTVRLWHARSGQPIGQPLTGHEGGVSSVAISPDGKRIVSGGSDRTVRLWDAERGQPIGQPLTGHEGGVSSVAITPDGQRIVSGSKSGTVRLWDAKSGQPIGQPLNGHQGRVFSVAVAPGGQHIVSGSEDGTVRLWDAKSGQPIGQPLREHRLAVNSVAVSSDGQRIVSGGDDGTVRLWPAPAAWPELLCAKLTRNFSQKEWDQYVGKDIQYVLQCPGLPKPAD